MITIKTKDNESRFEEGQISINEGSIRRFNLMKDDYIKLKFSRETNVPLLIGDYVDLTDYIQQYDNPNFSGEINPETGELRDETTKLFVVNRNYYPKYNKSTGGWDYEVQMDAYYKQWNNYILMYDHTSGSSEASFSLTDTIDKHASIIVNNLSALGLTFKGTGYSCEIRSEASSKGMKTVTYSGVSVYGALDLIAQTFECEWWLDGGSTIYFGIRKNEGEALTLNLNEQIADASTSTSEGTHATRLYAFGGTTNVPKHYRDELEFNVTDTFYQGTDTTNVNIKDSKKPISANWFLNTYKEEGKTFNLAGKESDKELTALYNSSTLGLGANQPILRGGNISVDVENLRVKFYPTVYGYKSSESTPSADVKVSFSISNVKEIPFPTSSYAFPKIQDMTGSNVALTENLYYYIQEGIVKYSKNGTHAIFSFPVKAGECYAIKHDRTRYGSVLRTAFAKTSISKGLEVTSLWDHESGGYDLVYVYCEAPDDGYIYCHVTNEYYAPEVKLVSAAECSLVDGNEHFSVSRSQDWYGLSLYAHVDKYSNTYNELGIKCRFSVDDFSISTQREDVAANTKIIFGENEYDAIINPYFDSAEIGHPIKVIGYRPNKNETYELPEILRSKVSEKHGHYFTAKTSGVVNAVVQKNIMLPEGVQYVEPEGMEDFIDNSNVVEAIAVYDWIYPKTDMKLLAVDPVPYTLEGGEGEEDEVITTYNIAIQINGFKWENMVVGDKLYTIFQAGSKLSGMRFELDHVSNGTMDVDGKEVEVATFKMIPNEDYSVWLPNDEFKPNVNDVVILDGIDVQYFDMNAIKKAEDEVLAQAKEDLKIMSKEDKVVDITLMSTDAYNRGRISMGQLVSLGEILSSDKKPYESRIIGFEEKLDIPYDSPKYIIGETNYYSTIASIESKISEVNKGSLTLSGMGGTGGSVSIIKTRDNTKPTDANVFSALRVDENFMHTKSDDEVEGNISFKKNISVEGVADINEVDANRTYTDTLNVSSDARIGGNQTVKGAQTLYKGFSTPNFMDAGGQITGAQLTENGVMTLSGLKAMSFEIFELIYNTIRSQGGKFAFSNSANIESVKYKMVDGSVLEPDEYDSNEWGGKTFIDGIDSVYLTIKKDDVNKGMPFVDGDIIYGYVNAIGESGQYARGGQCVMYIINPDKSEVLDDMVVKAILFPIGDPATNKQAVVSNIPPTNGMDVAQRGNVNPVEHPDRLTSFFIDTETANLYMLSNVTSPTLDKSNYAVVNGQLPTDLYNEIVKYYSFLKPYDPVNYSRYVICENLLQFDYLGRPIQRENNRGEWSPREYDAEGNQIEPYKNLPAYYDTVTYNGELWKCVEDETLDEPSKGNGWLLLVAKGDDGTSIKVKGSFDSATELPTKPEDPSDCYIVGQDLYVWDGTQWKNVGQFKGDKGDRGEDGANGKDGQSVVLNLMDNTNFTRWAGEVPERWEKAESVTLELVESKDSGIGANAIAIAKIVQNSLSQTSEVQQSTWYILSFYAKSIEEAISGRISISNRDYSIIVDGKGTSSTTYISMSIDTQWQQHTIVFKASSNETTISFGAFRSSTETLLLSKVKLEAVADQSNYTQAKSTEWCLSTYDMEGIKGEDGKDGKDGVNGTDGKDGANGADAISFFAAPSTLNVEVSAQEQTLINNYTHTFTVYARTANEILSTEDYVIITNGGSSYRFGTPTISDGKYRFTVNILDNTHRDDIAPFTVYFIDKNNSIFGELLVSVVVSQQGIVGPQGEAGAMIYPYGNWERGYAYQLVRDAEGKVVGKPSVYYLASNTEEGAYYVLEKDVPQDVAATMTSPSLDYWKPMTKMQYIYTEALMANFAKFGSNEGGVFYNRYLFSQMGLNRQGEYSLFNKDMFSNGKLNGSFIPSLIFDFKNGSASATNLLEPYREAKRTSVIRITPETGFNILIKPEITSLSNVEGKTYRMKSPLVILPDIYTIGLDLFEVNGAHVTITYGNGGGAYAALMKNDDDQRNHAENEFLLVCADDSCISPKKVEGYGKALYATDIRGNVLEYGYDNFIFNGGRRGKYIMMSPGSSVKLRPYIMNEGSGGNRIYWQVESPDVYEKNVTVYHTAYSLPTKSVDNKDKYEVKFHNDATMSPSIATNTGGEWTYEVYSQKTRLFGASGTDLDNLTSDINQVSNTKRGYVYGACFACGVLRMLPDSIVIAAHLNEDGSVKESYRENDYNYYHYSAFDGHHFGDYIID